MNMLVFYEGVGGFIVNVLNLLELPNVPKERWPDLKSPFYWMAFIVWPILGGFLVHLYLASGCVFNPLLSFHIGLSAPLIIRAMASTIPPPGPRGDGYNKDS